MRVLVADDHAVCRAGLARLVEHAPDLTLVGVAANGREAVELAGVHRPDVVLMDIEMPLLDGIEATRLLLSGEDAPRVLAITLSVNSERIREALNAGACGCVFKDAEPDELVEALHAASRSPRTHAEHRA